MARIKVKDVAKASIKTLDRTISTMDKAKRGITRLNEEVDKTQGGEENQASSFTNIPVQTINKVIDKTNDIGKKSVRNSKENIIKTKQKIKSFKNKMKAKKGTKKGFKATSKGATKTSKKVVQETGKNIQRAKKVAKETAKATAKTMKAIVKVTAKIIKGIISGTKMLIELIVAGGWIAIMIIIILSIIGLLFASIFGIFFSGEKTGNNDMTMNQALLQMNSELNSSITKIKESNTYDDFVLVSNQAKWKDVLAIYSVKVASGNSQEEVVTIDSKKLNILRQIFWDMNTIEHEVRTETEQEGDTLTQPGQTKRVLYITISGKTAEEMKIVYHLSSTQQKDLKELLNQKYDSMWYSIIFGSSIGSSDMVKIATAELGNKGGEKFWRWYGLQSRTEWCAIFVSWVGYQAGYTETGQFPKFSTCRTQGVPWFKTMGLWQEAGYTPNSGDIIFYDWDKNGTADHVGIVDRVENDTIYTVEGNLDDAVKQTSHKINSKDIYGFGTPAY